MPNDSQFEDHGLRHKQSCYKPLNSTWTYTCPHKNINYSGFNNGVNCLCKGMPMERSSMDKLMIHGKQNMLPVGNQRLGWKT